MSTVKSKFNALAAVKLMAAEDEDDDDDQQATSHSDSENFSSFLSVTMECSKPLKSILKKKEQTHSTEDSTSNNAESHTTNEKTLNDSTSKENIGTTLNEQSTQSDRHVLKVSNLPIEVKTQELVTFLGIWPKNGYDGIKFVCDSVGDPKGYAYLEIATHNEKMSMLRTSGVAFKKNPVTFTICSAEIMDQEWEESKKIHKQIERSSYVRIGNLPFILDTQGIRNLLHKYKRKLEDIYIWSDKPNHQNAGYCYVIMKSAAQADKICNVPLKYKNRKLVVRKIHPEMLSRWCKRNNLKLDLRESSEDDDTDSQETNQSIESAKDDKDNAKDMKSDTTSSDNKTEENDNSDANNKPVEVFKNDPKSNVFIYDPNNVDSIEIDVSKQDVKEITTNTLNYKTASGVIVCDEQGSPMKTKEASSNKYPKFSKKKQKQLERSKMMEPTAGPPHPFPSPPFGPVRPPFLPGPMGFGPPRPFPDGMRPPLPGMASMHPRMRLLPPGGFRSPMEQMFAPGMGPSTDIRGPHPNMRMPPPDMRGPPPDMRGPSPDMQRPPSGMQGPHPDMRGPYPNMPGPPGPALPPPPRSGMPLPPGVRSGGPFLHGQLNPVRPPNDAAVGPPPFSQPGPATLFKIQSGFIPTIHIRMHDVPDRASSDDIKDFFHPVVPAKITQNVGTSIYDVDFFNPDDAVTSLKRSGLMIRKNVVKLEMLPGPFVPLPPPKLKSKKREKKNEEHSRKRHASPKPVHENQPPPMLAQKSPYSPPPKKPEEKPIIIPPFPDDPLEYRLKPFDPNIPEGQCTIQPMKGFFCQICRKFYKSESSALLVHCKSKMHYDNVKSYLEKIKVKSND